jgi:DNA-binding MarR family transcriptional regulator
VLTIYDAAMTDLRGLSETHEIAGLLLALIGQTATQGERCARECGLSIVQASALLNIDSGMTMRELATNLGGHPSNATGIADRLAARGLIERHDDAADRRVKRISLTPEGAAIQGQLMSCMEAAPAPFGRLSGPERTLLRDLLLQALDPESTDMLEARSRAARILGFIDQD